MGDKEHLQKVAQQEHDGADQSQGSESAEVARPDGALESEGFLTGGLLDNNDIHAADLHQMSSTSQTRGLDELEKAKAKKRAEEKMLKKSLEEQMQMKQRVVRLQNELLRSRSLTATHRYSMSALKSSDAEKQKMLARKGLDHMKKGSGLKKVQRATEEELTKFSKAFKQHHQAMFGSLDPIHRTWYGLFKKYDSNHDHCISYPELQAMTRKLEMTGKAPEKLLMSIWRALDEEDKGLIDAGTFGRFYRKADVVLMRQELHAMSERYQSGSYAARPVMAMEVGHLAIAKEMRCRSRAKTELDALRPIELARLEAQSSAKRLDAEQRRLEKELKKVSREKQRLERTLSKRGALKSSFNGPPSSLSASLSASRSLLKGAAKDAAARELHREDSWMPFEPLHGDESFAVFMPSRVEEKHVSPSRGSGEAARPQSRSGDEERPVSRSSLAETLSASRRIAESDWGSAWEEVGEVSEEGEIEQ